MKTAYQKAKSQIHTLSEIDSESRWVLALDLVVIVAAIGFGVGVMAP